MTSMRSLRHLLFVGLVLVLALPVSAADPVSDRYTTFFVGRLKYSQNDGDDCGTVAQELGHLLGRASTIEVQQEKKIRLADDSLFETPFLFMNGHDDFVLSEPELANLRKYFINGGFLLGSGCCNAQAFPIAWRREMSRVFPGNPVRKIPYDHIIYKTFYKMDHLRALDKGNEDIQLDGLFYGDELVAVMCEDGLCCSFAMGNECNAGHGLAPEDGRMIALNIAVYALTH
jgi:hypothetical protein